MNLYIIIPGNDSCVGPEVGARGPSRGRLPPHVGVAIGQTDGSISQMNEDGGGRQTRAQKPATALGSECAAAAAFVRD